MSVLAKILGRLIFCLGVMITVVGCVIGSTVGATSGTTMPGVTLMAVGAVIYWIGSTKACPQCSKRVKHAALECKHCGSDLSAREKAN
jgi:uncharacterized membrane protein